MKLNAAAIYSILFSGIPQCRGCGWCRADRQAEREAPCSCTDSDTCGEECQHRLGRRPRSGRRGVRIS
jgi:hypothetical protein